MKQVSELREVKELAGGGGRGGWSLEDTEKDSGNSSASLFLGGPPVYTLYSI